MKIIVFGSKGMLGRYVTKYFKNSYEVLEINREVGFDAKFFDQQKNELKTLIENFVYAKKFMHPEFAIINCLGATKQKVQDPHELFEVNGQFPLKLAEFFNKPHYNVKIIHVSSDCVFSGLKGQYDEFDPRDANDFYGMSKIIGEEISKYPFAKTIRTSIIGEEEKSKKSLLEWCISNKGKLVNGYTNHFWNGVTCLQLCYGIEQILLHWKECPSTINYFSTKSGISKYDLLEIISDVYSLSLEIEKFQSEQSIDRRLSTCNANFFNVVPDLKTQLIKQKGFL